MNLDFDLKENFPRTVMPQRADASPSKGSHLSQRKFHNQYLGDSTDVLLRKNLLQLQAPEGAMQLVASTPPGTISREKERAPMRSAVRRTVSLNLSPLHLSPHPRSLLLLRPSSLSFRQHPSSIVPLVLALLLCLAHSVFSTPTLGENSLAVPPSDITTSRPSASTLAHISTHSFPPSHSSHRVPLQKTVIYEKLNPIELNLLDHFLKNHRALRRGFHYTKSRNAYGEHIFDPSSEEITNKLESSARTSSTSQKRDIHEPIEGMYVMPREQPSHVIIRNHNDHFPVGHPLAEKGMPQQVEESLTESAEEMSPNGGNPTEEVGTRDIPKRLYWLHPARPHLTLGEAHALVKSVINNGLVEQLDSKTLEHLTNKYAPGTELDKDEDFIELHAETSNESNEAADLSKRAKNDKSAPKSFENEEPLNPEEELLTINRSKEPETDTQSTMQLKSLADIVDPKLNQVTAENDKQVSEIGKPKASFPGAIINEELFKNYQNLEQVMEILMHSENTLKKRGEGPQLSIDSALTVLRERLLLELARRKAKATQTQIAINSEILKKLGRRRRSVDNLEVVERSHSKKRSRAMNCDETNCNLDDLNSNWSNVHQSLANLASYSSLAGNSADQKSDTEASAASTRIGPYYNWPLKVGQQQRFRNNDKYTVFDDERDEQGHRTNQVEVESRPHEDDFIIALKGIYRNRLTYSGALQNSLLERSRVNSRKPILSSAKQTQVSSKVSAIPFFYRRFSKVIRDHSGDSPQRVEHNRNQIGKVNLVPRMK